MFDPATYGYPLKPSFDRKTLDRLLNHFEGEVKRESDRKLALDLRSQLLTSNIPTLKRTTFYQLAKWCKTDGIYGDGMQVAQRISELLFGRVLDRTSWGSDKSAEVNCLTVHGSRT
jgi:hypothetical protein